MLKPSYSGIRSIILPHDLTVYMPECLDDRKAQIEKYGRRRVKFNRAYYLDPKDFGVTYPFHMWREHGSNSFVDYVVYVVPKGTKVYYDDLYREVAVKPKDESRLIRKYVTFNIKESSRFSFCMMLREKMGWKYHKWEELAKKIVVTDRIFYPKEDERLVDIKTADFIVNNLYEVNLAMYFQIRPFIDGVYWVKQHGPSYWYRIFHSHTSYGIKNEVDSYSTYRAILIKD